LNLEFKFRLFNYFIYRAGEIQIAEIINIDIKESLDLIFYYYKNYLNIFSKTVSNLLSLYKIYNYKIVLENSVKSDLGYSFLYKILIEELKIIK
jgi:hypothetical protein